MGFDSIELKISDSVKHKDSINPFHTTPIILFISFMDIIPRLKPIFIIKLKILH